ncbi:MAG TPA: histidine kinase dimerization/phospho-acceptor domain-containing protein [Nannocystaceae bacterium]|nr:histidine kinase dimerization/phospho-acceptor domain-containing protein [Nannocystaceae bacterium]
MATAQRDALLELMSVLAHDLNNPLQTLLVLSELALDESPAGSEAHDRAKQCLAAADRLKVLTQAMGASLRGRPQDIQQVWGRVQTMLGRRLERYGVTVSTQLAALGTTPFGGDAEWAVLMAVLAVIATASTSSVRRHELAIVGALVGEHAQLELGLTAIDAEGVRRPLAFQAQAVARLCDVVPGATSDRDAERVVVPLARAV